MNSIAWQFTWFYAKTQLKLKYRFTLLGFLWNFLEPALYLIVLSVVFSVVNRMDITDYAVFLFSALVPWRYFEKIISTCTDAITGGDWLLKKMPVSPFVFPLTRWLVATFEFFFSLVVMFVVFLILKDQWSVHILILPLAIIPWSMLGLGVGMISAVLFTFLRDIRPIMNMVLMILFFSAPILFSPQIFEAGSLQESMLKWHPITYYAALFQKPVHLGIWPDALDWGISLGLGAAALLAGIFLIHRYRGKFYFYL